MIDIGLNLTSSQFAGDATLVQNEDPVRKGEDLPKVRRNQQYPHALRLDLLQDRLDGLNRADVHAPRRLGRDQKLRADLHFPRDDHLLRVAAGERTGRLAGVDRREPPDVWC